MTLIVKFLHGEEYPGCEDKAQSSIYSDVTSLHLPKHDAADQTAILWVREPVKTALVPGFCEDRRNVDITGPVYVMNEAGKTISVYRPSRVDPVVSGTGSKQAAPSETYLGLLPYDLAASIRRSAVDAGDHSLIAALDRQGVAVDAAPVFQTYNGYEPIIVTQD